jgi:hypothetical protein
VLHQPLAAGHDADADQAPAADRAATEPIGRFPLVSIKQTIG